MKYKHLTLQDRQSIKQMLNSKKTFAEICCLCYLIPLTERSQFRRYVQPAGCGCFRRMEETSQSLRMKYVWFEERKPCDLSK